MFANRRCGVSSFLVLALLAFLTCAPFALPQALTMVQSSARYAGSSAAGFNGDFGTAATVSLSNPSYLAFDSHGNQFVSDTLNNCVRRIDTAGNVTTVAGLSVSGQGDTCNSSSSSNPTASQGLYRPTGLAVDKNDRLYIADSMHHCVRALDSGMTGTANLTTAAGVCTSVAINSSTPSPNGLVVDGAGNLYITLQDSLSTTAVSQVVRHSSTSGAISVCVVAGAPSVNAPAKCPGITGGIILVRPSGLALTISGDLFIADTGNNCVREVVGLATSAATQATAVGQCLNDGSGTSTTALHNPYGLALSPMQSLFISESNPDNIVSFVPGATSVKLVGGLPSGIAGAYDSTQDGASALNVTLNNPRGLAFDSLAHLFVVDSLNNITRELSTNLHFPNTPVGSPSSTQPITFIIQQAVNLTTTAGTDYSITSTTCSGSLSPAASGAAPMTCQVFVRFTPTRPGMRRSPLKISDSVSGSSLYQGLQAVGMGALSLFTPGGPSTIASGLAAPASIATDAAGNAFVLETSSTTPAIRMLPAAGGASSVILNSGLVTPTALASDAAGNWFVADAAHGTVARFGADGSVNTSYLTGLDTPTSLQVDLFNNLYIAQAGTAHNVLQVYTSGALRTVAGGGSNLAADGVAATTAGFVSPSAITLGLNGSLYVADQGGHRVYAIDKAGLIHIAAGNGTTTTTTAGQATGTALVAPSSIAIDAAGDLYVADQSTGFVYAVYSTSISNPSTGGGDNIAVILDATAPSGPNGPLNIALDGSSNLFVSRTATNSVLELAYPNPTLNFGTVQVGSASTVKLQKITNVGTTNLDITAPFSTTDTHFAVDTSATTCGTTILSGSVCTLGFRFTPTANTAYAANSILSSNSYNAPQPIALFATGKLTGQLAATLPAETETYGKAFAQTVNFSGLTTAPTGTLSFTYGGAALCTISGTLSASVTCNATSSGLAVGVYAVALNYSGDTNYSAASGTTNLTVTPAPLAVIVGNASRLFGAANPTFASTLTGVVPGDTFLVSLATTATSASITGSYPIVATLTPTGSASLSNYTVSNTPGSLVITQTSTTIVLTTSAASALFGATITLTANVTGSIGTPTGAVSYFDGTVLLGTANLNASGIATLPVTTLAVGTHTLSASFGTAANFSTSAATVSQTIIQATGSFSLSANPPAPFLKGPGTTSYQVTVASIGAFAGPVALSCSGLPADASCTFAAPSIALTAGSSSTTTMTVTTTVADARLQSPAGMLSNSADLAPLTLATIFPFELTGLGVLFAGIRRRKTIGTQRSKLLLMIVCSLAILGLTGCGCPSSTFKTYTITITGTSLSSPAPAQTTSVVLSVGQQ